MTNAPAPNTREAELLECLMEIRRLCLAQRIRLNLKSTSIGLGNTILDEIENVLWPKDEHGR